MATITVRGANSWETGALLSGPMVGEVRTTEAWVWAQAKQEGNLTLTVDGVGSFSAQAAAPWGCVKFHVTGLNPDTTYTYTIAGFDSVQRVIRTAPAPSARRARICFGSCFKNGAPQSLPIFDHIAAASPNLFIMTGDSCYYQEGDLVDLDAMVRRQLDSRNNDSLRRLHNQVPVVAIWDDHDYGENNSDYRFLLNGAANPHVTRSQSLAIFQTVWANSHYGTSPPGVYSAIHLGPIDVFLTDGRYHRIKEPTSSQNPQVLGPDQLSWLKNALKASSAPLKVVVSGTTVLSRFVAHIDPPAGWEGWEIDGHDEREELLQFLDDNHVTGVIFASGDLHTGYIYHRSGSVIGAQRGATRWELVSSPLEHDPWHEASVAVGVDGGPYQKYWDSGVYAEVHERNFGDIDIDLDRAGAEVKMELRGSDGGTRISRTASLASLAPHTPDPPRLSGAGWRDNRAYFFRNGRFVEYRTGDPGHVQHTDAGPKPITPSWPCASVDAAVIAASGKSYVFTGNGYYRMTLTDPAGNLWSLDEDYPTYILRHWLGFWSHDIDAATLWPKDGLLYFFRGDECIACHSDKHQAEPGYPRKIAQRFPHLPAEFQSGIDAVVVWSPQVAYFFKGDKYARVTIATETTDDNYPKDVSVGFPELATL